MHSQIKSHSSKFTLFQQIWIKHLMLSILLPANSLHFHIASTINNIPPICQIFYTCLLLIFHTHRWCRECWASSSTGSGVWRWSRTWGKNGGSSPWCITPPHCKLQRGGSIPSSRSSTWTSSCPTQKSVLLCQLLKFFFSSFCTSWLAWFKDCFLCYVTI